MKKSKQKASSGFVWKEYSKPIIIIAVIIAVFGAFLLIVYEPMRPGDTVAGTLQSEYKSKDNPYISKYFVIELDNGVRVDVPADRLGEFQKDREIILQKMTGLFTRRTEYKFVRYGN